MKDSKQTNVPGGQFDTEAFSSSDTDKKEEQETPDTIAVERTTDDVTGQSPGHALAPQDGGWKAWLVLFGAFVVTIATFGLINSFGVFQTYYETELLSDHSSSDISWIGSLQGALLTMFGIVSGPLYDMGYFRALTVTGLFLVIFSLFMTSLCSQYWQVLLAQGLCCGLGCGLLFLPSVAVLSQYFVKRRAIAIGIQSVGSPLGGIIFPIIFSRLQPVIGFGWATRIIAFILLGTVPIPLIFMRPRVPALKHKRAFIDNSVFTDLPFVIWGVASFFAFLGLYVPFFYIQLFAIRYRLASLDFSAYLVTLLNAGSIVGRLLPNFIADHLGSLTMLIATTFGASVMAFGWLGVDDLGGLVVFALLYGFFNGGITSLPQSAIISMTPDVSGLGTRMGMAFVLIGLAVLIGNPIAGAILRNSSDTASWRGLMAFTAATLLVGSALYLPAQMLHLRRQSNLTTNGVS
ncbi:major facilitator superfamily domain-containing protein [Biscogniauxia sp. FL1348]|nr:major facilitator superfamily domain-containing protein [Biscogniauxia sp. FL1348]